MRLPPPRARVRPESTITLINVVFLMLIFFLIAGSLTPPLDGDVSLISTSQSDRADPPAALFVTSEGAVRWRGVETTASDHVAAMRDAEVADEIVVKLAADRALPAERLIDLVGELRAAGATRVLVVTERSER
jgi:biopolymer transport protein ExbD